MTSPQDGPPRFAELSAEYEILREIGRGESTVVYLARELQLARNVTIKVVQEGHAGEEAAAAALVREARILGGLEHPNILTLYGTRRLREGSLALVRQYVPGEDLRRILERTGPLPFRRVDRILRDLAGALGHLHRQGIVHADVRPENVFLEEGTHHARLTGFASARSFHAADGPDLSAAALTTPSYVSPEQLAEQPLDGRSDLYSLGVLGYEMLTGETPWHGESVFTIVERREQGVLPHVGNLRPGAPPEMQATVEGALHPDPDDRWASAEEFLAALGVGHAGGDAPEEEEEDGPVAAPVGVWQDALEKRLAERRAEQERRDAEQARRRNRLGMAAGVLVLLISIVALATSRSGDDDEEWTSLADAAGAPLPAAEADTEEPAGPATVAYALSGDGQEGVAGDTLPRWLVVRVEDAAGRSVEGTWVHFSVTAGQGVVIPDSVATDPYGVAGARWLPASPGEHAAEATVPAIAGSRALFRATVRPGGPARISRVSPGELVGGAGERSPLAVRVEDASGRPLEGAEVRFAVRSGGGTVAPEVVRTAADGTARAAWSLGDATSQEATATLTDASGADVVFRAGPEQPAALTVRPAVTAGGTHTCALDGNGAAFCWGGNDAGQLGDGSSQRRGTATRVALSEPLAMLSAGVSQTCAVAVSGTTFCWGANAAGQLGDGSRVTRAEPTRVATPTPLTTVATGSSHSCGLDRAGRVYCWGQNNHGQLGDGSRSARTEPVRVAGGHTFRALAVGWDHTCALAGDGEAYCWGRNDAGQLGDGSGADRAGPVPVTGGQRFSAITAGGRHTCALTGQGVVHCWGQNTHGQLGNGGGTNSNVPVRVADGQAFTAVTAGGVHTCGLTSAGTARCWGRNTYGQLGDGSSEDRRTPVAVLGGLRFSSLQASGAHTCGTAGGGAGYCWGYNLEGQLGDGTRSNQTRPVAIARQR